MSSTTASTPPGSGLAAPTPRLPPELILLVGTHLQRLSQHRTLSSLSLVSRNHNELLTPLLYDTVHLTPHSACIFAPHRAGCMNNGCTPADLLLPASKPVIMPLGPQQTEERLLKRLELVKRLILHQPPSPESGIMSCLRKLRAEREFALGRAHGHESGMYPRGNHLLLPNLDSIVLSAHFVEDIMAGPVVPALDTMDPAELEDYGVPPPTPASTHHLAATAYLRVLGAVSAPKHVCVDLPPPDLLDPASIPHLIENPHLQTSISELASQAALNATMIGRPGTDSDASRGRGRGMGRSGRSDRTRGMGGTDGTRASGGRVKGEANAPGFALETLTYHSVWKHSLPTTTARRRRAFFIPLAAPPLPRIRPRSRSRSPARAADMSPALRALTSKRVSDLDRSFQLTGLLVDLELQAARSGTGEGKGDDGLGDDHGDCMAEWEAVGAFSGLQCLLSPPETNLANDGDRNQDLDPDADADADADAGADDTDDLGPRIIDEAITRSRNELIQKWGRDDHQTETIHAVNRLRIIEEEEEEDICCEACGYGAVLDSREAQGHFQRS